MKKLLFCTLFVFVAINFCSAQAVKVEKKPADAQVEAQKPAVQDAPAMEKLDADFKKAEEVIKDQQEKVDQAKADLQKLREELGEAALTNEDFKKAEADLKQAEEDLLKAAEEFKTKAEEVRKVRTESTEMKKDEATEQ